MARILLDTHIVVFLLVSELDNISKDIKLIINDFNNQLCVSSVSVLEILQLMRIKKFQAKKYNSVAAFLDAIEKEFYIKIIPFSKEHVGVLSTLNIPPDHNDPFDHAIIAQAVAEKMTLVSSDKKFKSYAGQMRLAFNRR